MKWLAQSQSIYMQCKYLCNALALINVLKCLIEKELFNFDKDIKMYLADEVECKLFFSSI